MSKEKEDIAGFIPRNEYQDDLEAEVQYHTARILAGNPFRVNKKYTHIEIPDFGDDKKARLTWELEEVRRCREGYDGMPGRYYWFFNHVWIKHKSRGKIRPDFRASALNLAKHIDEVVKTPGRGLVNIKRRQYGMSWYFASDNVYECTFNKEFDIGMSSKGLVDSNNLFIKHKYVHRNVSPFLRAYVSTDRRDAMVFGKWVEKEKRWKGNNSSIISVAPTPTGHAGNQYRRICFDEAGETEDLMAIWANAEDTVMQETQRVGTPMIFGTMGDTLKSGKGLMEFWTRAEDYNLTRFGIWGYNSLLMDALGNDLIEDSVRWIIYSRKKNESKSPLVRNKFIQKYPLTQEDAFLVVSGAGIGDPIVLSKQYTKLMENPPLQHKGSMRLNAGGGIDFVPNELNGKIIIYERPEQVANGYVAACDPAEDDDVNKSRDTSNLSTAIIAKPFGLAPPRLVAEYTDRPSKLAEYYEQLALLLQWYNNTPVYLELNKGGFRMKDYFEQRWPKLLALSPKSFNSVKQGFEMKIGVKMTAERKTQMMGLGDAYVEEYCEAIPSLRLIEEFKVFGGDHVDDDLACAFLWTLIALQSDKRVATGINSENAKNPSFHYQRVGNTLQIVGRGGQPLTNTAQKISNPLFNRR